MGKAAEIGDKAVRTSPLALAIATARMRSRSSGQRARFRRLSIGFEGLYRRLSSRDISVWVTPLWEQFNAKLERSLLPRPPWKFLRDSTIKKTMFVDARGPWLASQASYLRSRLEEQELASLLPEAPAGDPPLAWARFRASHNSVHHLTHLERYREATGFDPAGAAAIVEWGGGYGNLARIVRRLAEVRGGRPPTYTIIDTPLLCALQWLYLGTVLGEELVHVLGEGESPRIGAVNLLTVGLIEHAKLESDLFISTWALSESSPLAQDYAAKRWFGGAAGGRLLLAAQESSAALPDAGRIPMLAEAAGAREMSVPELPGNSYSFR